MKYTHQIAVDTFMISSISKDIRTTIWKDKFAVIILPNQFHLESDSLTLQKFINQHLYADTLVSKSQKKDFNIKRILIQKFKDGYIWMQKDSTEFKKSKQMHFTYCIEKNNNFSCIKDDIWKLSDFEVNEKTGFRISKLEIMIMYNAVKQKK